MNHSLAVSSLVRKREGPFLRVDARVSWMALAAQFGEAINKAGGQSEFISVKSEHVIPMPEINEVMALFMAKQ